MEQFGKKTESGLVRIAISAIAVCVCFIFDVRLGFGAVIGAFAAFFGWPFSGESAQGEQGEQDGSFVDPDVLRENFSIPKNLPIPYAVLDVRGHLLMCNEKFAEVLPEREQMKRTLEQIMKKKGKGGRIELEIGGKFYEAGLENCDVTEENGAVGTVLTLTLADVTAQYALERRLADSETVVGMIFLDNYEEVADGLDEDRVPILSAVIDRKLNQFAQELDGVVKKLEKDRYIFLLSNGMLEKLKERKFDILNVLREVSVGEHIPVTMSMGIGVGGGSLETAMRNAKAALDLALGRGGDQVLIKEGEKYLFYGGKAGEMGRNARIRARVKADALWELMGEASDILVMGHRHADLDSLGSCMGICAIAEAMGKKCRIIMNEIGVGIERLYENMAQAGHYEARLVKDADAVKLMEEKTLAIVVDTHRSSMVEGPQVLAAAKKIVLFDHHRKSTTDFIEQAVLIYHEPYASSTAELVTEMIQHFGKKIKLKPIEADALLAGITVDTKNFCGKTGAITFEAAGFLRRNGADSIRVRLLFQNDMDTYKAKATAVRDAEIFMENIAISVCPSNVENSALTAAQAADDLMNVTGIKASFVCCKVGDMIYISARSFGEINVQRIMEKLGGGGHFTVSGAQLKDCTLEEAKEKIRGAIEEYLKEESI